MTTQYGFFIDSSRCTGCKTCELACKDFKDLGPEVSFRRIYEYAGGDWQEDNGVWHQNVFAYYLSISCNHCDDPACTKVCPSGAMHKREDGFVVVDEDLSGPILAATILRAARVTFNTTPFAIISILALIACAGLIVLQGLSLASIHSSVQQASALVPDYASLQVWRVVLLCAGLGCWLCPLIRRREPHVAGLVLGLILILGGEMIGRVLFYGLHMTVGMAIAG
ncbi:DmsC/YnfH family molybdoenzyme membrane anchor subunit [Escherichia coli]|uniref:DmsC/YnfH family molybdoenzyme membrane anchor subunit n=1 Tax=Escherichia coli TaxID=562 RepID=UPI003F63F6C5